MKDDPKIAIIAVSGIFPGATGVEQFWSNIRNKVDTTKKVPANRWNKLPNSFLQASGAPDKAYSENACLLTDFKLDYEGIDLDAGYIDQLDSLFQWVLYASREALQNCNLDALDKRRVGAILAAIALPTRTSSLISQRYF